MSGAAAQEILVGGARALALAHGLKPTLQVLLGLIAQPFGVESAVVFVVGASPGRLELAAATGITGPALTGLVSAVANPAHPIAMTAAHPEASFDVQPTAPGGPALRSHLPLIVWRDNSDAVVGVLALAHDRSIDPGMRPILLAVADLAAVAIERRPEGTGATPGATR